MKLDFSRWRGPLLFALLLLGLFLAARQFPLLGWIESFRVWAAGFGFLGVLIYGLVYGLAALLLMPCLPFSVFAGFTFGWLGGLLAVNLGIALGAAGGFLIIRATARGKLARRIEKNPRFRAIDDAIAREGWKIVGLLRMCPVPFGLTNYLYGLTAIEFWRYLAATMVGMLPGNALFVYLGVIGKKTLDGPRHPLEYGAALLALAAMIAVVIILRRIARRTARL